MDPTACNEQVLTNSEVLRDWRGDRHGFELCCNAAMEVNTGVVWLAHRHILAGTKDLNPEQNPIRRIPWSTGPSQVLASSHDGTLGAHDPRRAREVS